MRSYERCPDICAMFLKNCSVNRDSFRFNKLTAKGYSEPGIALTKTMYFPYWNVLGIRNQQVLDDAEANYVSLRLRELAKNPLEGNYDIGHLAEMQSLQLVQVHLL